MDTTAKISFGELKISVLPGIWGVSEEGTGRSRESNGSVFEGSHMEYVETVEWGPNVELPDGTSGYRCFDLWTEAEQFHLLLCFTFLNERFM